jgi:hypothetical protein
VGRGKQKEDFFWQQQVRWSEAHGPTGVQQSQFVKKTRQERKKERKKERKIVEKTERKKYRRKGRAETKPRRDRDKG